MYEDSQPDRTGHAVMGCDCCDRAVPADWMC